MSQLAAPFDVCVQVGVRLRLPSTRAGAQLCQSAVWGDVGGEFGLKSFFLGRFTVIKLTFYHC